MDLRYFFLWQVWDPLRRKGASIHSNNLEILQKDPFFQIVAMDTRSLLQSGSQKSTLDPSQQSGKRALCTSTDRSIFPDTQSSVHEALDMSVCWKACFPTPSHLKERKGKEKIQKLRDRDKKIEEREGGESNWHPSLLVWAHFPFVRPPSPLFFLLTWTYLSIYLSLYPSI
jgi:hypothetical protein